MTIARNDNAPGKIEEMVSMGLLPDGPAAAALVYPDLWPKVGDAKNAGFNARAKSPRVNILDRFSNNQLNGLNPLLDKYSRGIKPFNAPGTNSSLSDSIAKTIEGLVRTWGLKPLAFGALSRMKQAQARVERSSKRALKFKFMFDPNLIHDPQAWLSERTSLEIDVKYQNPCRWSYSVDDWNAEPEISFIELLGGKAEDEAGIDTKARNGVGNKQKVKESPWL